MGSRIGFVATASLVAVLALPAMAAQYEKTGNWVFNSAAFAADGDAMVYACSAGTESADGVGLLLTVAPAAEGGFEAVVSVSNEAWAIDAGPVRVGFDIGADHWVLPGQGEGATVEMTWTGDPAFLTFIEGLASSSFAALTGRDGAEVAQFSLTGSRGAIEAMKACAVEQIGRALDDVFEADAVTGANPF